MSNLFDEYPALLVLPEVLLAIVIVVAIVIMRRKPSPKRRVRAIRPMPSDTVDPIDAQTPGNPGATDDPLKREDWSDDRR